MEVSTDQIKEIIAAVKVKALRFSQSKLAKISGAILLFVFLLLAAVPLFFNNSSLKFQIISKAGDVLGANLLINGDVDVSLFPTPRVTIHDVVIQDWKPAFENLDVAKIYNFYASKVVIKLPIFNFDKNFRIKEILFKDVFLERYYDNDSAPIRQNNLTSIITTMSSKADLSRVGTGSGITGELFAIKNFKFSQINYTLPKLTIVNGEFINYGPFGHKKEITKIGGKLVLKKKNISASLSFSSDNIASNLQARLEFNSDFGDNDSFLKIHSSVLNLEILGDFAHENKILEKGLLDNDFRGKVNLEIAELKSFYRNYFNNFDLFANRLKYTGKPISFASDLSIEDGELMLKNINVKSTLLNGSGTINLSKKDENLTMLDANVELENIDLDEIWSHEDLEGEALASVKKPTAKEKEEVIQNINLDLSRKIKNLDLNAEIKVKNVKYLNGQINDLNLYLTASNEGKILVMPLIFQIPGRGTIRMSGVIDNDELYPKFIGKIDGNGKSLGDSLKWLKFSSQSLKFNNLKDYSFYANILLLPNSISLHHLYLSLNNNDSEILGELKINDFAKVTNSSGRFRMSKLVVDDYFFTAAQNIYLSPGSLLKKIFWLNNIRINGYFDLTFDRLFYGDEIYKNQRSRIRFKPGILKIERASFNSDKSTIEASLAIDISKVIPQFNLRISGKKLDYTTSQINFVDNGGGISTSKNRNFFDQIYALPSVESFYGTINVDIDDLSIDGVEMNNFKLGGKLKDGNIPDATASSEIYGGNLQYYGFLGIKLRKTINGNLTLSNVEVNPLLNDALGIKNIYGITNISSSLTSIASNKKEFLKELSSELNFTSASPYIEKYGLSSLIKKMIYLNNFREDLKNPEAILLDSNVKTIFTEARGNFTISAGQNSKLKIKVSAPAMNGILAGTFNPAEDSLDLLFNAIFITGTSKKQTPINIAASIKGSISNPQQSTNIDQVRQYLGLPKKHVVKKAAVKKKVKSSDVFGDQDDHEYFSNEIVRPQRERDATKTTLIDILPQMLEVPIDQTQ
jgi:uncharacterized protein involved in outer membrane biogenesis